MSNEVTPIKTWASRPQESAPQPSLEQVFAQGIRSMFQGKVDFVGIAPNGDPYAHISIPLSMTTDQFNESLRSNPKWNEPADTANKKISAILKENAPGLTVECCIQHDETIKPPVKAHIFLYGDKHTPETATVDGLNATMYAKQHQLSTLINQAFGFQKVQALSK